MRRYLQSIVFDNSAERHNANPHSRNGGELCSQLFQHDLVRTGGKLDGRLIEDSLRHDRTVEDDGVVEEQSIPSIGLNKYFELARGSDRVVTNPPAARRRPEVGVGVLMGCKSVQFLFFGFAPRRARGYYCSLDRRTGFFALQIGFGKCGVYYSACRALGIGSELREASHLIGATNAA